MTASIAMSPGLCYSLDTFAQVGDDRCTRRADDRDSPAHQHHGQDPARHCGRRAIALADVATVTHAHQIGPPKLLIVA